MRKQKNKTKKLTGFLILVFVSISILLFTFSDGSVIPNWHTILNFSNNKQNYKETDDFVKVMDVGQGDSILIYSNGFSLLVDTGLPEAATDIGENLSLYNIKSIDAVMISHLHMDHMGGIETLSKMFNFRNLIIPDLEHDAEGLPAVKNAKEVVINSSGGVFTAVTGMNLNIGEFEITILGYFPQNKEENNRSIVAMAKIQGVKFLLTGDAEKEEENQLIDNGINLDCDVLKVGHHGSSSSTQRKFLDATTPKYAAISVGENNMYQHPHIETLEALNDYSVKTYRTDLNGDISFFVENGNISVKTEK